MKFSEKLCDLRKQFKFSQEQLAEKIGVSRQAITKWETDGGLPDIENLMAIAALFSVPMDDLMSEEKLFRAPSEYAYESVTEYDISRLMSFDIHAPGALEVRVSATSREKLRVKLSSNVLQTLSQDYKTSLDEHRNRMDVDIRRVGKISEANGKEALCIHIFLPDKYCKEAELSVISETIYLDGINFSFELDGKARKIYMKNVKGTVALNCNTDMEVFADRLPDAIEINQINATSVLEIPHDAAFYTKIKGKSNSIRFAEDGKPSEAPANTDVETRIELTGMNAELLINKRRSAQ